MTTDTDGRLVERTPLRSEAPAVGDAPGEAVCVPKQMPQVSARLSHGTGAMQCGIQSHRYSKGYNMIDKLKAPLPYPGGKSDAAALIWSYLGDTPSYVEPFMGSAAVLLARPHDLDGKTETCNDIDGFLTNSYRAIQYAPDETAYYCDRPVNEIDLTAYHLWLKSLRTDLTQRLFADPFYYDARVAGAFLWGIASWIGDGWCVADGPWIVQDGLLVDRRTIGSEVEGVWKTKPVLGAPGEGGARLQGIQRYRAEGVPRKMPEIDHERGIGCHVAPGALLAYFARLSDRLRRVRFLCGDWTRAVKDSVTVNHGLTGLFIDSPYPAAEHDMAYHAEHGGDVWYEAAEWAVAHGDDHRLRICVAGYDSEATDALFPASWAREHWQARGGYANQKSDGRGRANAKRETLWFSKYCLDPLEQARDALSRPMIARESDYVGTLFEEVV
jgi:hypothetical protein